jgi:hypothetical protein
MERLKLISEPVVLIDWTSTDHELAKSCAPASGTRAAWSAAEYRFMLFVVKLVRYFSTASAAVTRAEEVFLR